MKKFVIVMRGISGAGKSTVARQLAEGTPGAVIVSADQFFGEGEAYIQNFCPERLNEAHESCFRSFMDAVNAGAPLIIVDNTSMGDCEIAPYMLAGRAYGYETGVLQIVCDPEVAAARTVHGTPPEVIQKMTAQMARPLPPWWKIETLRMG